MFDDRFSNVRTVIWKMLRLSGPGIEPVSAWPSAGSIGRGFDNKFHFDAIGDGGRLRAPTIIIRMIINGV